MWLLLFICVFKVDGAPINETHNATNPATGANVSAAFDMTLPTSAETLEELEDDVIVQEGDILMPEDRNAVETLWPGINIPYTVDHQLANREGDILAAFSMISDHTCIRFHRRTTEVNYLRFLNGRGCASYVGCRGGAQKLYFAQSCSVGNLCHEIIHALGFHHEHTRADRDQYIGVQWQSIMSGREKNFRVKHGNTLNLPYDLNSIMHYGITVLGFIRLTGKTTNASLTQYEYFFTADRNPTILPKQGVAQMGQRTHLSPLDIVRLNRLYHCDERGHLM